MASACSWSANPALLCGMPAVALEPQLVDRTSRAPEGDSWIHEIKYDGYRLLASLQRGKVWLYSRSGADWTTQLPWIAKGVGLLGRSDVLIDGELVYLDDDGFPDFERLWSATRSGGEHARLYYQVFDVLRLNELRMGTPDESRVFMEMKRSVQPLRSCSSWSTSSQSAASTP